MNPSGNRISTRVLWLALAVACSTPVPSLVGLRNGANGGTSGQVASSTTTGSGTPGSSSGLTSTAGGSPVGSGSSGGGGGCSALFAPAVQIDTGVGPSIVPGDLPPTDWGHSLAVGDLNGDGKLDLTIGYYGDPYPPSDIGFLLGAGDGSFQPTIYIDAGPFPAAALIGNLSSAGSGTLAVAEGWSQTIGIFQLSSGMMRNEATLASPLNCSFADTAYLRVADFNRDGWPDILLGADTEGNCTSSVAVLLGFDGGWTSVWSSTTAAYPETVGDFDGDGIPDLVFATSPLSGLQFLRGKGDGTFDAPVAIGSGASAAFSGDLNEDGVLDLLAIPFDGPMTVLFGVGDGTFTVGPNAVPSLSPVGPVGLVDLNGDSHLDLVGTDWGTNLVHVALGNGDGTFQREALLPIADTRPNAIATWVTVGDVNGDGRPDLIVGNYYDGNVNLFLNTCH
jgi:hypothetical protein